MMLFSKWSANNTVAYFSCDLTSMKNGLSNPSTGWLDLKHRRPFYTQGNSNHKTQAVIWPIKTE
jgi:hypothetical protein